MEDITNVVDDGGTEELLARLSHHVSSQLNVPPPQPDPHGDLLLRTMLYGDLLDGAGERVGEEVVGPSARREADEAAVLRSALTDGAERMLAEHAQTLRDVGDVTVRSRRDDDVSEDTEHVVGHVLDRLRRLMGDGDESVTQQPNITLQTLRGGEGPPRAASRPASGRRAPGRQAAARRRATRPALRHMPVVDTMAPPRWARACYKVVAVLDGLALSIYDGETEYRIGQTVLHPHGDDHAGGLYVSDTIEGCLRRDANMFPAESALIDAPRGILKVLAWNKERHTPPSRYGTKLAFSYVRGVELLPYPTSWPNDRQQRAALHVDRPPAPTYNAQGELPEEDPFVYRMGETISMGPEPRMRSLLRAQARTVQLEEEVREMERALEMRLAGV